MTGLIPSRLSRPEVMYHGTSSAYIDSIKRQGIVPGASKGATHWGLMRSLHLRRAKDDAIRPATYLSTKAAMAAAFARIVADMTGGTPVLLSIKLPEAQTELIERDPDFSFDLLNGAFKTHHIVKSEWLVDLLDASEMKFDPSMDFASNPDFVKQRNAEFAARFFPGSAYWSAFLGAGCESSAQ